MSPRLVTFVSIACLPWLLAAVQIDDVTRITELSLDPGGTIISAAPTGWDLQHHDAVELDLRNTGSAPVIVRARIENADAGRMRDAIEDQTEISPGEQRTLRLPIVPRPADPTFAPFAPFMMYVNSLNVRDGTIDPSDVRRLVLTTSSAGVELHAIHAVGNGKASPVPFFPFVDGYGQYIHGHWHGKIYSDADLSYWKNEETKEIAAHPAAADWDEYGGWNSGPTLPATGFFYPAKHDNKWWLVTPAGHLFWSIGVTGVGAAGDRTPITDREKWFSDLPPRDGPLSDFYSRGRDAQFKYYQDKTYAAFDFGAANLLRKYGPDYRTISRDLIHQRLRSWGFNTIGNWSSENVYLLRKTPYTVAIHFGRMDFGHRHDVFAPDFQQQLRARMQREAHTSADDPWNLGYFVDNELNWGNDPDGIAVSLDAMRAPADQPSKRQFVADLRAEYSEIETLNRAWETTYASWDALAQSRDVPATRSAGLKKDLSAFGSKFIEAYFATVRDELKRVAPHNLYLGPRFNSSIHPTVMAIAAEYCDVISYNIYDANPVGRINHYPTIDKPFLASEWGIESDLQQTPFGRSADAKKDAWDPATRTNFMKRYMKSATTNRFLVGAHFFQYRDQPISGRPDGEAVLRGFVNIADTPNDPLVQTNREIARQLYSQRAH